MQEGWAELTTSLVMKMTTTLCLWLLVEEEAKRERKIKGKTKERITSKTTFDLSTLSPKNAF